MPGRCGTICSRDSGRSSAMAPSAVTMPIVTRRLAIIAIAETAPCQRCRPPFARPDIGASGLWLNASLDPRKELLITQPGGLFQLTVGDLRTCAPRRHYTLGKR